MYGDFALSMLKVIGVMLGAFTIMLLLLISVMQIWVRRKVQNCIYAIFLDNKRLFSKLLKIEGDCVYYGKGDKKERYLLDVNKQFWVMWPPIMSNLIGASVRAHWYTRNRPEPMDPAGKAGNMTSRALRLIGDESMLKTTWKDIRETTGAGAPVRAGMNNMVAILLIALAIMNGFGLYMLMQMQDMLAPIANLITGS